MTTQITLQHYQQVSSHLKVAQENIKKIQEWAHVYFVVIRGIGGRFVSKKVVKIVEPIRYEITRWTNHAKEWVAKITGLSAKFGFEREFCPVVERNWSSSGKSGTTVVLINSDGYYQVSSPSTGKYGHDARFFIKVENGEILENITAEEIKRHFAN